MCILTGSGHYAGLDSDLNLVRPTGSKICSHRKREAYHLEAHGLVVHGPYEEVMNDVQLRLAGWNTEQGVLRHRVPPQ